MATTVDTGFMVGWPTWFGNRRPGLGDRRFLLAAWAVCRSQPIPTDQMHHLPSGHR